MLVPAGSLYANKESTGPDCVRDELVASLGGGLRRKDSTRLSSERGTGRASLRRSDEPDERRHQLFPADPGSRMQDGDRARFSAFPLDRRALRRLTRAVSLTRASISIVTFRLTIRLSGLLIGLASPSTLHPLRTTPPFTVVVIAPGHRAISPSTQGEQVTRNRKRESRLDIDSYALFSYALTALVSLLMIAGAGSPKHAASIAKLPMWAAARIVPNICVVSASNIQRPEKR